MTHWNTNDIIALLQNLPCKIEKHSQGGDVDTTNLYLTADDAGYDPTLERNFAIHLCGFKTEGDITNPDDCDIDMIELTDGMDSSGGLNTDDEATAQLYFKVRKILRQAGFEVVNTMDDYF